MALLPVIMHVKILAFYRLVLLASMNVAVGSLTKRRKLNRNQMKVNPEKERLVAVTEDANDDALGASTPSHQLDSRLPPTTPAKGRASRTNGSRNRIWLHWAWSLHFAVAAFVLTKGIVDNHGSR